MGLGKKYQPEHVVHLLRPIEVAIANGKTTGQASREAGILANVPEFVAKDLRKWLAKTGTKTLYIEPGSPWENGYCESFHSKLRDEFLNGEIFYLIQELRVLAERWRVHYNTLRPHSSLGYRPPAQKIGHANLSWENG